MFLTHPNELSTFAFKLFLNNSLIGTSKISFKLNNKEGNNQKEHINFERILDESNTEKYVIIVKLTYKQINKRNDLDLLEELSKEKKQTNFNMSLISM